jgi:hypothetical protein
LNPQARGSRPRRYANLRTRSNKLRVGELHPAVQAYEARLSLRPPASCRPRYRTGHTGLMKASWAPAAPAMFFSDQGESRTPMPLRARRSERRASTSCATWSSSSPCGNRTRLASVRGWHPIPIDERAMLSVRRAGLEPAQPVAGDLQSLGLADAQPTHVSMARAGVEPAGHQGLSLAALPICVPRHVPSDLDGI